MTKHKHNLAYTTDPETGRVSVGVLLSNRPRRAWVFEDDYHRIVAQVGETPWFLNDNGSGLEYVRLGNPARGNLHMVARLVTGEKPRKVIKYWDGDRCNLRGSNLVVAKGHGGVKRKTQQWRVVDEFATELPVAEGHGGVKRKSPQWQRVDDFATELLA